MQQNLFGTDGIRGPAGVYPLDSAGVTQIGRAVAAYFTKHGELILVGRDPRESSPMLAKAVIEGLVAGGARVEDVGMLPTPGLAYLTKQRGAQAGVMITASHNPYSDNGIKVFTAAGDKLTDEIQAGLNELILSELSDVPGGSSAEVPDAVQEYRRFLVASAEGNRLNGLKLALDSANGATSGVAAQVFTELGAEVTPLFDRPDGRNINVACGATDTAALQAQVAERQLDGGAAFDGDGDRVMLVDSQGRLLSGDHLLYILAVCGHEPGVVATLMSNQGLETSLQKHDIPLHRTAVGDRYVLEGMAQTGLQLGGEQSGHIILAHYSPTGDGLLAAVRTLVQVQASGKSLADWHDELQLLPQAICNIPLHNKQLLDHPDVEAFIARNSQELQGSGRLNIRASGTEPKLRIMVEAPDAEERSKRLAEELATILAPLDKEEA